MNFAQLLILIPLGIGVAWLFYLIFKQDLASKSLANILSYFLGVLIIVVVVGWLIDTMLPNWLNTRVQNARQSVELREFVDTTSNLIEDSVSPDNSGAVLLPAPTPINPALFPEQGQPTPSTGGLNGQTGSADVQPNAGTHIVVSGDTLTTIAAQYGVTVAALREANSRYNDLIIIGEQLVIPSATTSPGK